MAALAATAPDVSAGVARALATSEWPEPALALFAPDWCSRTASSGEHDLKGIPDRWPLYAAAA